MAGRFTIQRFPRGVLDLFGMKGSGETPAELAALLQGTADLQPFYLAEHLQRRSFNAGGAVAAVGTSVWSAGTTPPIVPPGEVWVVYNLSLNQSANLAVGESYTLKLGYARGGLGAGAQYHFDDEPAETFLGTAAGVRIAMGKEWVRPLILQPGDAMCYSVIAVTAGATNLNGVLSYASLSV